MRLDGKVVLITGGAGGIGQAAARLFLDEGAAGVFLVDLSEDDLRQAAEALGQGDDGGARSAGRVAWAAADVSSDAETARFMGQAVERFGRLDVLFLNAGVEGVVRPLTEYPEEVWDQVLDVNVKGVWLGLKHGFPILEEAGGGSVVITSSVAGLQGTANVVAYVTSKHALVGTMRVAALEGAGRGIRVNSIHPAPIDNRMMRSLEEGFSPGHGDEVKEGFEAMIPLGRYGTNEEVARLALFLASDESSYTTGGIFTVDGGLTA